MRSLDSLHLELVENFETYENKDDILSFLESKMSSFSAIALDNVRNNGSDELHELLSDETTVLLLAHHAENLVGLVVLKQDTEIPKQESLKSNLHFIHILLEPAYQQKGLEQIFFDEIEIYNQIHSKKGNFIAIRWEKQVEDVALLESQGFLFSAVLDINNMGDSQFLYVKEIPP